MALRWNFPAMRKIYIDFLDKFLKDFTLDKVMLMCRKEPSFRGFWYESEFFNHYGSATSLIVEYITPKAKKERSTSLSLQISKVITLDETETQLKTGYLYEMRARYPIIDAVGYLKDNSSKEE